MVNAIPLTVQGGIRQTAPYIWSYYNQGPVAWAFSPPATITYLTSDYEPIGIPSPMTSGVFTIPYAGVYSILFVTRSENTGGVNIQLQTNESGSGDVVRRSAYTNINGSISILYTKQFAYLDYLFFDILTASIQQISYVTLTIQYLG